MMVGLSVRADAWFATLVAESVALLAERSCMMISGVKKKTK